MRSDPLLRLVSAFGDVLVRHRQQQHLTVDALATAAGAYSGDCDRLFRSKMTAHSGGSALGGFLTPIGHVASTFLSFPGSSIDRVLRGNPKGSLPR